MSDTPRTITTRYNERARAGAALVRGVLQEAAKDGLPSEHHFISPFIPG